MTRPLLLRGRLRTWHALLLDGGLQSWTKDSNHLDRASGKFKHKTCVGITERRHWTSSVAQRLLHQPERAIPANSHAPTKLASSSDELDFSSFPWASAGAGDGTSGKSGKSASNPQNDGATPAQLRQASLSAPRLCGHPSN